MTFVANQQLAQWSPSSGGFITALSGGGQDAPRIEVNLVVVANTTGSAATFSLCHDLDGATFDETTALFWEKSIAAGDTFVFQAQHPSGGLPLGKNGNLGFYSITPEALTITIYGVTSVAKDNSNG